MGIFDRLFKKKARGEKSHLGSQADRMAKVNSLANDLAVYYKVHPSSDNEILLQLSLILTAYTLALDYLTGCTMFGVTEINRLVEILAPAMPSEGEAVRRMIPQVGAVLPLDRIKLRQDYGRHLMSEINIAADVGRQLLKVRELKDQGRSDGDIQRFVASWKTENIF